MLKLNVTNETSRLRAVVLGRAKSNGPAPTLEEAYDPKSIQHIKAGTYPKVEDMVEEMNAVAKVLEKYDVQVFRPTIIKDYNQIFSRDIAFVIDDKMVIANILPDRAKEIEAIEHVWSQVPKENRIKLPEEAHVEGGDVMLYDDYIFIGTYRGEDYPSYITARTNMKAVEALTDLFPNKTVKSFNLRKSNTIPQDNALHLDCCFQPVGKGKAIIHQNGFLEAEEYEWLVNFFGKDNVFEITKEEMYHMNSNIFSISEDVVISETDCGTINGILADDLKEGEDIIEPLSERVLGRTLLEDFIEGKTKIKSGTMIRDEEAKVVSESNIESLRIRSVLTCESLRGVCAKCYGWNPSNHKLVDLGTAVGIQAAQSIGEPGTQLTLRTFHIGGTATRIIEQSEMKKRFLN